MGLCSDCLASKTHLRRYKRNGQTDSVGTLETIGDQVSQHSE